MPLDGGGRTQDVCSELKIVPVCREPFNRGEHDATARTDVLFLSSVCNIEWSTHALLKSTWSLVSFL